MDYKKLYHAIIKNATNREEITGYVEKHHIIPRSLGGNDHTTNIVKLTAREHFICHYLLAKMYHYNTVEWFKMNHAFMMMKAKAATHNRYINNRLYQELRANFSAVMSNVQSGEDNSQYKSRWIYNSELRLNKKIRRTEPIPNGWNIGRKFRWDDIVIQCKCCGNSFNQKTKEMYCSDECRKTVKRQYSPTAKWKPLLQKIAKNYTITYGSISLNAKFIIDALDKNIPKNQIVWFLQCNNSGANYATIKEIINTPVYPLATNQ